jgi:hypothetical protein
MEMIDLIITFGSFGLNPDLKLACRPDPDLKPFRIRYTALEGKAIETKFLSKKRAPVLLLLPWYKLC